MVSVDRGTGPAVVFGHGMLMDRSKFDPQLDALVGDYLPEAGHSSNLENPEPANAAIGESLADLH